jgi:hypothetical protein
MPPKAALLRGGRGEVVLGDWDWVSIGPREIDLIPTWHAAARYGKGETWVSDFVHRYGYDLSSWDSTRP